MNGFKSACSILGVGALLASLALTSVARAEDDGGFSAAMGGMVLPESDPAPAPAPARTPAAAAPSGEDPGTFVLNRASFDPPSPEPAK